MKRLFLLAVITATVFAQKSLAQDNISLASNQLLNSYYQLKDNLVKSNPTAAAASAGELIKAINAGEKEWLNDDAKVVLLKDATAIFQSADIKKQREQFASLSNNIVELAKTKKLSPEPIYIQYCPMKKASWLSNDKAIKNPYYGNAMLSCGRVKETL